MVHTEYIHLKTKGDCHIIDITEDVDRILDGGKVNDGIVTISVIGSTGALTTCEYEPGLVKDLKEFFDKIIPQGKTHHDQAWGDGNGHSHLRSSLVGPSLTIPFNNQKCILGTWQQIIFIDFDNRPRDRKLVLVMIGE